MKVIAISAIEGARDILRKALDHGYLTFIYHHADPAHKLVRDKFLYVHDDAELMEKLALIRADITIKDSIRL